MTKHIINLSLVSKISIVDKQPCTHFEWRDEHWFKIFGIPICKQKARYYDDATLSIYTAEYIREGKYNNIKFIEENKTFYWKPYVKLFVGKDCILCQEFDTFEDALKWGEEQAVKGGMGNHKLVISR